MAGAHPCAGGCGDRIPRQRYACESCWYRLPAEIRIAVKRHYLRHTDARRIALHEAHEWFTQHPLSTQDKD